MTSPRHTIRVASEADLQAVAQIHISSCRDAYKGVLPDGVFARRSVEGFLSVWQSIFAQYPANVTVATSLPTARTGCRSLCKDRIRADNRTSGSRS
jgi:hypothetical protein